MPDDMTFRNGETFTLESLVEETERGLQRTRVVIHPADGADVSALEDSAEVILSRAAEPGAAYVFPPLPTLEVAEMYTNEFMPAMREHLRRMERRFAEYERQVAERMGLLPTEPGDLVFYSFGPDLATPAGEWAARQAAERVRWQSLEETEQDPYDLSMLNYAGELADEYMFLSDDTSTPQRREAQQAYYLDQCWRCDAPVDREDEVGLCGLCKEHLRDL